MIDNDSESITASKLDWSPSVERMLTRWCDEAKCFEWMHTEAFSYFDKRARFIVVTTNVLIALTGLTNVIAGNADINGFKLSWVFGSLSILISIANMLQEKLAYIAKATKHNQYAIQWGAIRRKIEEGISIAPEARKDCKTFLKYLRQDINLVSTNGNTMLPKFIRDACFEKFNKIEQFDIPDICGRMEHTAVYTKVDVIPSIPNTNRNPKQIPSKKYYNETAKALLYQSPITRLSLKKPETVRESTSESEVASPIEIAVTIEKS